MKIAAILLTSLGLVVAGSAVASDRLSDLDYLKANRCRGLAAGLGSADTTNLDSLLKTEGRTRVEYVYEKGLEERERGKRDAGHYDSKERLTAELTGPCTAFLGGGDGGRETARSR